MHLASASAYNLNGMTSGIVRVSCRRKNPVTARARKPGYFSDATRHFHFFFFKLAKTQQNTYNIIRT